MKSDRRVTYTRMVLKQALLELLLEQPINRITVTEICARADVNRATFYAHYNDPYDLLARIENELFEAIERSIANSGVDAGGLKRLLTEICRSIRDHGELCRVIFSEYGDRDFLDRVINIARPQSFALWRRFLPQTSEAELERIYTFFSHGSAAVIRAWVHGEMREPPEEIAAFIQHISTGALKQLAAQRSGTD